MVFEVSDAQFGQDTDASESVLERLRREFEDKFQAPLQEVAGKVGMLGNIRFFIPSDSDEGEFGLPEVGCLAVFKYNGDPNLSEGKAVSVHFEIGPERVGKEARFFYDNKEERNEFRSIPDAFKELVRIIEEQGKMIPKI